MSILINERKVLSKLIVDLGTEVWGSLIGLVQIVIGNKQLCGSFFWQQLSSKVSARAHPQWKKKKLNITDGLKKPLKIERFNAFFLSIKNNVH